MHPFCEVAVPPGGFRRCPRGGWLVEFVAFMKEPR